MSETNTAVFFKARPAGLPVPDETFEVKTGLPMPKVERDGDVLVRNINLSLDPAMVRRCVDWTRRTRDFDADAVSDASDNSGDG